MVTLMFGATGFRSKYPTTCKHKPRLLSVFVVKLTGEQVILMTLKVRRTRAGYRYFHDFTMNKKLKGKMQGGGGIRN